MWPFLVLWMCAACTPTPYDDEIVTSEEIAATDEIPEPVSGIAEQEASSANQESVPDFLPALSVFGNGHRVEEDATPSADLHTDFGAVLLGSIPTLRVFTVCNESHASLTLGALELPEGFILASPLVDTLAPAECGRLSLRLGTTQAGIWGGTIRIQDQDGLPASPSFRVQGAVLESAPTLRISGNGVEIEPGNFIPNAFDHTDFGSVGQDNTAAATFTLWNLGDTTLTLTEVSVPEGFILTTLPADTLAPGTSTTLQVDLDTSTQGIKTGTLQIVSNDDRRNPFAFALQGIVTEPGPAIAISRNDIQLLNEAIPNPVHGSLFGITALEEARIHTFTIHNQGTLPLRVDAIDVSAGFVLVASPPDEVLVPGATTTFQVEIDSSTLGTKTGTVRIDSNDPHRSLFTFSVQGVVVSRALPVYVFSDASWLTPIRRDAAPNTMIRTDFGNISQGSGDPFFLTRSFTIRNGSRSPLSLTVSVPEGFILTSPPEDAIAPGSSTTFDVRIDDATLGLKQGEIGIYSSDVHHDPFYFSIRGVIAEPQGPRMSVYGNHRSIVNRVFSASPDDHTDFGPVSVGGSPVLRTFTIRNTGDMPLELDEIDVPAGFTLVSPPISLLPGEDADLQIRLDTSDAGTKTGVVTISHNGTNLNPFFFWIEGTVR